MRSSLIMLTLVFGVPVIGLPMISTGVCPDADDLVTGLSGQQVHRGKDIYLGGSYWDVSESQVFKKKAECRLPNFFEALDCYVKQEEIKKREEIKKQGIKKLPEFKSLKFVKIPLGGTCKYQVFISGVSGIYGEFTLSPAKP